MQKHNPDTNHMLSAHSKGNWVIDAVSLKARLDSPEPNSPEPGNSGDKNQRSTLIVDAGSDKDYAEGHIPGAVHLDYSNLICGVKPATGKFPDLQQLAQALSGIGLSEEVDVIVYDHNAGAQAGRLAWTLDMVGHHQWLWLDGGYSAWLAAGGKAELTPNAPNTSEFTIDTLQPANADTDYILRAMDDPNILVWDVRSEDEYLGRKSPSRRWGHIPGAVNLNWIETFDESNHRKLKSPDTIRAMLAEIGVTPDKEIIVHCQTHQRSSHSYVTLKSLGFEKVRAYDGSWSEWGNRDDLPIDSGPDS